MNEIVKLPDDGALPRRETRRVFCANACRAASIVAFGGAASALLQGCANPLNGSNAAALPIVSASVSGRSLVVTVDASSPLASVGGAALVESSIGAVLVARTAAGTFTALTSTCTHQICTITDFGNQTYVCPCHGSEFDTSGRVVAGPAPYALAQHPTQFVNNVLTITV